VTSTSSTTERTSVTVVMVVMDREVDMVVLYTEVDMVVTTGASAVVTGNTVGIKSDQS